MKCDVMRPSWLQGCTCIAKWWWREKPVYKYKWHPRCGTHARVPGNSVAERLPITDPDPNMTPSGG